jgi:nucleotide-binding universal stress UspA family protein
MHSKLNPEDIVRVLKNCINWKNDRSITESKAVLNIFIDFLKLRIIPKRDSARNTFLSYINRPLSAKLEGKLEAWVEIGLEENEESQAELLKRIEQVEEFSKKVYGLIESDKTEQTETEQEQTTNKRSKDISTNELFGDENTEEEEFIPEYKDPILVPWDFSDVSGYALQHALLFAPILGGQIYLLNIAKREKEIQSATDKLEKIANDTFKKHNIKPGVIVRTGNIFTTITEIANNNRAKMVVMGTHGIKGMQKLTGSWALKVITGTNTPFIVVQNPPVGKEIKNIVFPVNHTKENKQKLKQARLLAKHYELNFTLVVAHDITNQQFKRNTKTNLNYVKSFFRQNNIMYEVKAIEGTDNSTEATLKYADENQPDLIMILTTKNINIQDYVLGADEQKIIANPYKVPVMCINPKKVIFSSYGSFGGAQ